MTRCYPFQKWILSSVVLSLIAGTTIACETKSPTIENSPENSPTPAAQVASAGVYRNDRLGFEFRYPEKNFVVDPQTKVPPTEELTIATIEIWTQQQYQKLKAGAYEGGTEYPANVQVAVYQNPKQLDLQNWVAQNNRFSAPKQFKPTTIAGRSGIAFQSSGLYEHEHIAFRSADREITLITLAKIGDSNNDSAYQTAFDQIIRSFKKI
ncbi:MULTISPECIES: hypothetical protein [Leptolyngbya]|nr:MULTISPECIES: hypothetical protein [Leptolyngbya]MBD2368958.1 hypothetical protein [Leptolyngbya sp. FACHB-161]MBD2375834.1 hypothetical protein [Leptolyngbya sp. FACHB-238]MBD2399948.1 hypothetical protein [Leptolyngbya sp. FACHB-239]MBD2406154.1 hypothetical protein [Leptolyngbya sp. FACHB-402]MCY6493986.1 hypothetical protein [Leptolyngbya sp. GGD]